jgi:two-component system phosphate regulon sensor histidine kinase PhoR
MIVEIIIIIGLTLIFSFALINVYYLKYAERFLKDIEEFQNSRKTFLIILFALILHSLYHLSDYFGLPYEHILEITSVYLLVVVMAISVKRALYMEITIEVRKEPKVRELMEYRTLESRLSDTSKELIETRNFFNSIIQSSADAIVASDLSKKITHFSKGAEKLFELKASDVIGMKVLDLYPKEVLRKKDRLNRAKILKKEGSIRNLEMKILTPKGGSKTISLSLSLLRDAYGSVKGTVGVAKDITKQVEAVDEVRYLKELSDKILEGTPDGLIILDLNMRVTLTNKGFERISGSKKETIVGKNALEYLKIPELDHLFEEMNLKKKFVEVTYNGEPLKPVEFRITIEGQPKTLTDYWTPLFDDNGNVEFVLIIIHDITKRKVLEDSLKDQAEILRRSNDLKDIFTDIMRHDLLNPIGVIKNYVELMSQEDVNPFIQKSMEAISRNAGKAVEMIENASKLEKIESVEELHFKEHDLGVILKRAVESVKIEARKKEMKIELVTKAKHPTRVSQFIEAVFLNLLTNAIKYSPNKTTVITGIEDRGENLRVFVKDNGPGIDDKFKDSVFTRFERLQKEGVKGTGLGLAIVKRIVEIHKGRVWVEDNPEGGSLFIVEIPKGLK